MKKGLIEQRHGRTCTRSDRCGCAWRYRTDGPEDLDGKRRQVTAGGFRTMTAAREALAEVQRRIGNGEVVGKSITVAKYLEEWLQAKETAGRREATMAQYLVYAKLYLTPHLGHLRLNELRAVHVDKMLAQLELEGKGLPTRHRVLAALSSALGMAEKRRLVSANVCRQVEIAPERTPKRPVYDANSLAVFLSQGSQDRLAVLWRLYAVLGLRRGEAIGLKWSDIDLDGGSLHIDRSLGTVDGKLTWGPPKSESGRRTVVLDASTVAGLRSHRASQNVEKLALGAGYSDIGLVFAREDGAPLRPEWVTRRFHALTTEAKLPSIHLHDLRHSAASLALQAGVAMKVVSENLGHSTLGITADIYSHVPTEMQRDAAERVAAAIEGA